MNRLVDAGRRPRAQDERALDPGRPHPGPRHGGRRGAEPEVARSSCCASCSRTSSGPARSGSCRSRWASISKAGRSSPTSPRCRTCSSPARPAPASRSGINAIITSLIYHYQHKEDLRLLMIDPKMVELSMYKDLPHLRHPVVTNNKEAAAGAQVGGRRDGAALRAARGQRRAQPDRLQPQGAGGQAAPASGAAAA